MSNHTQIQPVSWGKPVSPEIVPDETRGIALTIAQAAADRKGDNILVLKVADVSYLADYFVIVTGFSRVQVRAICQASIQKVEEEWRRSPLQVAGMTEGTWVLLDYGDVIVHILMPDERAFYHLEAFWGHGERVDISALLSLGNPPPPLSSF